MNAQAPFSRLVVALDGSRRAETAIYPAVVLARRAGIPLTLFAMAYDRDERDLVSRDLASLIPTLDDDVSIDVEVHASGAMMRFDGYVADAIVEHASRGDTLVCMASHGRGGSGAMLLGSVTELVLRRSSSPILVTGPRARRDALLDENSAVALCLDGSTFAERGVAPATALSEQFRMPLWMIQVAEPAGRPSVDVIRPCEVNEFGYLHSLATSNPHVANFDVLHSRQPAVAIAELPQRYPIGMIIMATHGRSGWSRVVLGSVAMSVVHRTTCPVLLVPQQHGAPGDDGVEATDQLT